MNAFSNKLGTTSAIIRGFLTRFILFWALLFGVTGVVPLAQTQDQPTSNTARSLPTPDAVVDIMGAKLNLSDDQKAQIKPIIVERRQQMQVLRQDTSLRPLQRKRRMKSIFNDSDKKIKAVLNDDQRKQYAQIERQLREEMKERMQNRGSSN